MKKLPAELFRDFVPELFVAAGSEKREAMIVADHLVEASLVGHDSHGLLRVPKYLNWVREGHLLPNQHALPFVDSGALVGLDGGFGFGQVIGLEAMDLAIERVRRHGFAAVGIRNSGHLGRIGAWAEQLANAGMVSIHFVNTSGFGILVAPYGGIDRRLSANPIAAGTPGPNGPIVLDIATSATAEGKIQVARNRGERLPPNLILDANGQPTDDPVAFYGPPAGSILPFGGHKGSGLSVFCEILAGSLTGGGSSHPQNSTAGRLVNNMLTLAFDPSAFGQAGSFASDVGQLEDWIRSSRPVSVGGEILLPGEVERRTMAERQQHGIPMDAATARQILEAATVLGIQPPGELVAIG
ncbi:MAG: malate/lactate/ureidoglycolate dehydrogenase [Planctomycetes bacterium]|nr:malate/lactate/ureidoglycolate dehydrogenase [Planctomycetota bacterium]